jgi:hypothetical protein
MAAGTSLSAEIRVDGNIKDFQDAYSQLEAQNGVRIQLLFLRRLNTDVFVLTKLIR